MARRQLLLSTTTTIKQVVAWSGSSASGGLALPDARDPK
jgi:hypothetical protein